jgi:putative cell wall-binding protein
VNGETHADAVSIAPYAGRSHIPILLVQPSAIPTATGQMRNVFGTAWKSTIVVGGPAAITDAVARSCPSPTRVAGANRYATNLAVIDKYYPGVQKFYVCNGFSAPDSLAAGALAAKDGRATLLVAARTINNYTRLWIENNESRIGAWTMVGGPAAVPYLQEWILRKAYL